MRGYEMRYITQSISFVLPVDCCVSWLRNGPYATQVYKTYQFILERLLQYDFDKHADSVHINRLKCTPHIASLLLIVYV